MGADMCRILRGQQVRKRAPRKNRCEPGLKPRRKQCWSESEARLGVDRAADFARGWHGVFRVTFIEQVETVERELQLVSRAPRDARTELGIRGIFGRRQLSDITQHRVGGPPAEVHRGLERGLRKRIVAGLLDAEQTRTTRTELQVFLQVTVTRGQS